MCSTSQLSTNSPTKTDESKVQQCDAVVVMEHYFPWVLVAKKTKLFYQHTRDLPGAGNHFFHNTFHKKEIEFLVQCAFLQILQHDCKNIATILRLMAKMPLEVLYVWDYISK